MYYKNVYINIHIHMYVYLSRVFFEQSCCLNLLIINACVAFLHPSMYIYFCVVLCIYILPIYLSVHRHI